MLSSFSSAWRGIGSRYLTIQLCTDRGSQRRTGMVGRPLYQVEWSESDHPQLLPHNRDRCLDKRVGGIQNLINLRPYMLSTVILARKGLQNRLMNLIVTLWREIQLSCCNEGKLCSMINSDCIFRLLNTSYRQPTHFLQSYDE